MSNLTRRGLLIGGATVAAVALQPGIAYAHESGDKTRTVPFTLNATVLDGGEQVTSVTLDTSCFGVIDPASLTTGTFTVHAKATSPLTVAPGMIFSEYDLDRVVTKARLEHGKIVLDLKTTDLVAGGGTLGYMTRNSRNVMLNLVYTITQNAALKLRGHGSLTLPGFTQGKLVDPEVDAYSYHVSKDGMNYRLFSPTQGGGRERDHGRGKRPLIVWLHGGGEGGSLPDNYYDNESLLRANRGALGFSTPAAQKIFGGAYVLAPQAESAWMSDGPGYAPRIKAIIDDLVKHYPIDVSQIEVVGCSNGGYMSLYLSYVYPKAFSASVPICPGASPVFFTDAQLASISTPTWLVQSKADTTLPPAVNSIRAHALIPGSLLSLYDTVTWNGITYNGHWSWIYVARNDPKIDGQHIWQWMAKQHLSTRR